MMQDFANIITTEPNYPDVKFLVEGKEVHAHILMLTRSPYFERMFFGGMSEGGAALIPLDDSKQQLPFVHMLEFLYTGSISRFDMLPLREWWKQDRMARKAKEASARSAAGPVQVGEKEPPRVEGSTPPLHNALLSRIAKVNVRREGLATKIASLEKDVEQLLGKNPTNKRELSDRDRKVKLAKETLEPLKKRIAIVEERIGKLEEEREKAEATGGDLKRVLNFVESVQLAINLLSLANEYLIPKLAGAFVIPFLFTFDFSYYHILVYFLFL
jgi:hypothetical protein